MLELDVDLSIATSNIILGFGENRVKRLMENDPFKEGLFGNLRANPQNNKLFWILIYSLMSKAANQSVTHMFFLYLNSPVHKNQSLALVHGKKFVQCNKAGYSY
jgi:hypothetical protein